MSGGSPNMLATGQDHPRAITVDANSVYSTTNGFATSNGMVMKVARTGGMPAMLATGETSAEAIAVDSTNVYWTVATSSGSVMKVGLGGGSPMTRSPAGRTTPTPSPSTAPRLLDHALRRHRDEGPDRRRPARHARQRAEAALRPRRRRQLRHRVNKNSGMGGSVMRTGK